MRDDGENAMMPMEAISGVRVSPLSSQSLAVSFSVFGASIDLAFTADPELLTRPSGVTLSPSDLFHSVFSPRSERTYRVYRGPNGSAALFVGDTLYKLSFAHPESGHHCVVAHTQAAADVTTSSPLRSQKATKAEKDTFVVTMASPSHLDGDHICGNHDAVEEPIDRPTSMPAAAHRHDVHSVGNSHNIKEMDQEDNTEGVTQFPEQSGVHLAGDGRQSGSTASYPGILSPPIGPCPQATKRITLSLAADYMFAARFEDPTSGTH